MSFPVILIILDQLVALKHIDPEVVKTLSAIKKFKKRSIYFDNYYTNAVPCSAARAVMFTGKHSNVNKMTENVEDDWQETMPTQSEGLKTMGTYFKENGYKMDR
jgi:arylsulfatase A-like enzyme